MLGWSKSILSKALLAAPAHATTCLLPPVVRLLTGLSRRSSREQKALEDHLQPFLSFALLNPGSTGEASCKLGGQFPVEVGWLFAHW